MPIRLPYTLIRTDRLALLEYLAACAVKLSYRVAGTDGDLGPEDAMLWDLHDIASQYEVYEHQRALGFPTRGGGLPRVPTVEELQEDWCAMREES